MKKIITATASTMLIMGAGNANAVVPLIDVDFTAGFWYGQPSGDVQSRGSNIDVEDDLDYSDQTHPELTLRVAHPAPLIPNARVRYIDIQHDGTGSISTRFENIDPSGSEDVESDLDLSHLDYTVFYTAPIPLVTLDVGINVKQFVGDFEIEGRDTGDRESLDIDEFLPMGHIRGDVDLPLTGLGVGAEVNYIGYSGDSARDIEAYLKYTLEPVYVQGGYREFGVDVDASGDLEVDTELKGPFLRVGVGF